ncbi:hypothetical protein C0V76_08830 [Uliginosibacterium sp. TH139]|nr:hypothetical protein C0V76_08830 [Uliginosibacterium sp. TH139]
MLASGGLSRLRPHIEAHQEQAPEVDPRQSLSRQAARLRALQLLQHRFQTAQAAPQRFGRIGLLHLLARTGSSLSCGTENRRPFT